MLIISELRRRNVIRVAMAYVAVAWLVVQVLDTLAPLFGINDDVARIIVIVLGIGLIPALIFAWVFEWTPDGLKRDSEADHSAPGTRRAAKRLDQVIISILVIAVIYFAFDKFVLDPARDVDLATEAAEKGRDGPCSIRSAIIQLLSCHSRISPPIRTRSISRMASPKRSSTYCHAFGTCASLRVHRHFRSRDKSWPPV